MTIARLTADDAEALQALRREALLLHPTAFSADPEIEAKLTIEQWRDRLSTHPWFGGKVDGVLSGMVAYTAQASAKTRHTGHIGSMYVRKEVRGSGMADALLEALIAHAAMHVEQLTLSVEATNTRAIKFYERHGFRAIGKLPCAILVDGKYFDELSMYRVVSSTD